MILLIFRYTNEPVEDVKCRLFFDIYYQKILNLKLFYRYLNAGPVYNFRSNL